MAGLWILLPLFVHALCIWLGLHDLGVECSAVAPPLPVLPVPSARQLLLSRRPMAMFLHFGMNTFTGRELGTGGEDPRLFDPAALDARQWVRAAKAAGFSLVILTAKHHDGFCLWPTQFSNHSVSSSPWRGGSGDVVQEVSHAAREQGLGLGIYLSPWDRHESSYGDEVGYNEYYQAQLQELLTSYGPVEEIWLDGYKGEDSPEQLYMVDSWTARIRQWLPMGNIFSDAGPDIRWVGNEAGEAGETCWSMVNRSHLSLGTLDVGYLNAGDVHGADWVPPQCDVSIRPSWFWHAKEKPKSLASLLDIYFNSVGRNCLLLLNVPPNKDGLLAAEDVAALEEFGAAIRSIFAVNLAAGAKVSASTFQGQDSKESHFRPSRILTDDLTNYWVPAPGHSTGYLDLDLGDWVSFNVAKIQEAIFLGQRIKSFEIHVWVRHAWQSLVSGTTVGYSRLLRFPQVNARFVRLTITEARGCPLVASFGLYLDAVTPQALISIRNSEVESLDSFSRYWGRTIGP